MAKATKPDLHWIHHQAGLAVSFEWQDEGRIAQLDSTTILGQIGDVWIVQADGTATDEVANGEYWWPIEELRAVYLQPDGKPRVRDLTDEEEAQVEKGL